MKFHSKSVDFVMDFCVNFLRGFLGVFHPLKRRTEIHRKIRSKIHDKIPAKSTHVVKTALQNPLCRKGGVAYGQNGVDLSFSRALPASISGHCSQVLVFASIWEHKKGVTETLFALFFQHLGNLRPQIYCKIGETAK